MTIVQSIKEHKIAFMIVVFGLISTGIYDKYINQGFGFFWDSIFTILAKIVGNPIILLVLVVSFFAWLYFLLTKKK